MVSVRYTQRETDGRNQRREEVCVPAEVRLHEGDSERESELLGGKSVFLLRVKSTGSVRSSCASGCSCTVRRVK
ncbi:hypothetical protein PBY51_004603 [Eleginops maclovinus]|uniref:Uncharacterized protein n=1 Tax=Eleginops maclovinus TaxID=56733 RepID=A0AAN7Y6F6_ELEMC|nr:hypothetical protein PBY51_004603 [Eleginops maclovinus]